MAGGLQAARRSVPPDVVADMKRKQATKTVKTLNARGANESARAAEKVEREARMYWAAPQPDVTNFSHIQQSTALHKKLEESLNAADVALIIDICDASDNPLKGDG